jgi:hypothetical protein
MNSLLKFSVLFCWLIIGNLCFSQADSSQLLKEELAIMSELTIGDSVYSITENEAVELTKFITLEFTDSLTYIAKKKAKIDFITLDTSIIRKINGLLSLPCKNSIETFKDNPVEEESIAIHTYVGQIKALNKYIVQSMYWEDYDYKLIDKTTCETTNYDFRGLPLLSPTKKHMISCVENVYSMSTDIGLFSVNKQEIKPLMFASFNQWMMAEEGFWSKDGYFYLAINKTKEYWTTAGAVRKPSYFIKIKLI